MKWQAFCTLSKQGVGEFSNALQTKMIVWRRRRRTHVSILIPHTIDSLASCPRPPRGSASFYQLTPPKLFLLFFTTMSFHSPLLGHNRDSRRKRLYGGAILCSRNANGIQNDRLGLTSLQIKFQPSRGRVIYSFFKSYSQRQAHQSCNRNKQLKTNFKADM